MPNRSYTVNVRKTTAASTTADNTLTAIERSSPAAITLAMKKEDIQNINFIVFRAINKYDLTGTVDTEPEWLHTLEVRPSSAIYLNRSSLSNDPLYSVSSLSVIIMIGIRC